MSDAPGASRDDRAWICRETIAEMMAPIMISAEIVQRYCELGDEAGIHYQLGCMAAYFRSAGAAYRELAAVRNEVLADESEGG
jgi:hypothetical protein